MTMRIIDNKRYDTDTAEQVAYYDNGMGSDSIRIEDRQNVYLAGTRQRCSRSTASSTPTHTFSTGNIPWTDTTARRRTAADHTTMRSASSRPWIGEKPIAPTVVEHCRGQPPQHRRYRDGREGF